MQNSNTIDFDKLWGGDPDEFKKTRETLKARLKSKYNGINVEDIEDCVSDAIRRACEKYDKFRGEAMFSTWLTRIAYNVCNEHLRKTEKEILWSDIEPTRKDDEDLEDQIIRKVCLEASFGVLSDRENKLVKLILNEGKGIKEIAQEWGTTEDAISSLRKRARDKLRSELTFFM